MDNGWDDYQNRKLINNFLNNIQNIHYTLICLLKLNNSLFQITTKYLKII